MNGSRKTAGYDQEEKFFHDLNQKLISARRESGTSKALTIRQPGKLIPFASSKSPKKTA